MKVTGLTRRHLRNRRARRDLLRAGYEEVTDRGGKLWELDRGFRIGHTITDVKIAPEGRTVFVKIEDTLGLGPFGQATSAP